MSSRPPPPPPPRGARPTRGASSIRGRGGPPPIFARPRAPLTGALPPKRPPIPSLTSVTVPSPADIPAVRSKFALMSTDSSSDSASGRDKCRGRLSTSILRTRPDDCTSKIGTSGNAVTISSNHFIMKCVAGWNLFHYHVDLDIEEDRTYMKKKYVRQVEKQLPPYIYDGSSLYTVIPLTKDKSPFEICTKREDDGVIIQMFMKLTREVSPLDFGYFQFFNIILRRCMEKLNLQVLDRNYYDPGSKVIIPELHLEVWPGYITSIRRHENEVMLCCEISNKILRTDSVHTQLRSVAGSGNIKEQAAKLLLGEIIITRYNNKTYKIGDIDWDSSPSSTFPKRDGTNMSYSEYYKERYGITIEDLKQPLLISLPRDRDRRSGKLMEDNRIVLIPELCFMTGLSESQRASFQLMKTLGEYTRQDPAKRCQSLKKFSQRLTTTQSVKEELEKWNIELDDKLRTFQGRALKPEILLGGGDRSFSYPAGNADWGSAFRNLRLFQPAMCMKWVLLVPTKLQSEAKEFVKSLHKVSNDMGFKLDFPKVVTLKDDRVGTYVNELNSILRLTPPPQMVLIVLPRNTGDSYSAVKKICCVERPIISQVVTGTLLRKPKGLMSVATKVAIQIATKLGAEPWGISIPVKNTMVVGYDSYHDSSNKGQSVGAVVSTINSTMTRFVSTVTFHRHSEELHSQIGICISRALRKYHEVNEEYPTRIIIYRDGVGDGQIETVKQHEIPAIKEVINQLKISPKFTFVVVSKRINSRFFLQTPQNMVNPNSGTIIDDVVTLPERYDFFLVSQSVRQGTVNPTSYNIIEDDSGLKPDHIQRLTYKLTHLYYNWNGTVRVPSVCQYAHKLAYLVGTYIHKNPDTALDSTLYYL